MVLVDTLASVGGTSTFMLPFSINARSVQVIINYIPPGKTGPYEERR
jgi:hypothetical protein